MAEYIEREALGSRLNERLTYLREKNGDYDHYTDGYDEAVDTVEDFPTADNAVEVVRCLDCKHSWQDVDGLCCSHGVCVDCTVPEDFYCSYGERK